MVMPPAQLSHRAFTYYRRLAKVEEFVFRRYHEPLELETVAAVAGLERTYFSRYFHDKTGVRFRQWLTWVRILQAVAQLRAKEVPVTRLAFAVGFQDLRTFQRAFRKHTGATPRQIRYVLRP
jgi:AraC-like DNA-binding protein